MPRNSSKVVNTSDVEVVNVNVSVASDNIATSAMPETNANEKKRAPVKRANKKNVSTPILNPIQGVSITPTTNDEKEPPSIQISDSVNTFNIHIKHVSDDGSNIENTFSTTYTHKSENGKHHDINNESDNDSSSVSSYNTDSDGDSDYDKKFTNSSLTLPVSSSYANSTGSGSVSISTSSVAQGIYEDANPLYTIQQINYDILIPFVLINMHASSRENIMALLHTTLISCIEGRCITEGFIKPHSTRIIDFKCGKIVAKNVQFNIVIECLVCNPQPQSIITCVAKNITQAGIRAVSDDEYSPIVVYITRDFGIDSDKTYYNSVKEGDIINVRVIGKRFEMNDKHIQIIGFLVQPKKERVAQVHSKKSLTNHVVQPSATETKTTLKSSAGAGASETKETKTTASKRGPRKTKNPLNIVNDTDNNVITITYDENIELPKEPKSSKTPKTPKTPKEPKEPKEPKAPKKPKKEIVANTNTTLSVTSE